MVDEVHGLNAHIAISIWPSFGTKTNLYKTFQEKGMLLSLKGWPDIDVGAAFERQRDL